MKPWKPCEHCYLKDKYCENAEREQPCVPVQEYLESGYEIKRLQKKLEIATKALEAYARGDSDAGNGCLYEMPAPSLAQQALKEKEEV